MQQQQHMPMYLKIKTYLLQEIKDGRYLPGDKILSENELKAKYGVSSSTVVKALTEMVYEGYLYRIQGKGTFVAKTKMNKTLNKILSFTEELKRKGFVPEIKLISVEEIFNKEITGYLGIKENEPICKIMRVRLADNEPLAVDTSYLSTKLLSKSEISELEKVQSLHSFLKNVKGFVPYRAKQHYSIKYCDQKISKLLEQDERQPNFFSTSITYTEDNLPLEYTESYIRWDRYTLEVDLTTE
ncbi:GntR family transcriptional regulator [Bacillus salipaludis]|uniref:GntR family transcriptional regulator n=1 Tax=Bacillus salipaludis TaxID=2547811 RepID=A0ABW8RJY0_9BACI